MSAIGIDEDHAQHLPNNERDDDEQARHREAQAERKEVWKTLEPKWLEPKWLRTNIGLKTPTMNQLLSSRHNF